MTKPNPRPKKEVKSEEQKWREGLVRAILAEMEHTYCSQCNETEPLDNSDAAAIIDAVAEYCNKNGILF